MNDLLIDLARVLQNRRPKNILILCQSHEFDTELKQLGRGLPSSSHIKITDPLTWLNHPHIERRYSLGIVWDFPLNFPSADYDHLLARLRDLDCEVVYLRYLAKSDNTQQWLQHLRSLGFLPLKKYTNKTALFYFDIYDYKMLPDWLNSKFWANPEMWNKTRS